MRNYSSKQRRQKNDLFSKDRESQLPVTEVEGYWEEQHAILQERCELLLAEKKKLEVQNAAGNKLIASVSNAVDLYRKQVVDSMGNFDNIIKDWEQNLRR